MQQILQQAEINQQKAWNIIEETHIIDLWKSIGAEIHLVGSLKSGLLMKHLDIDFHIYSDPINIQESFSVIAKLAENPAIKHLEYTNLLDTQEECIEWHAQYQDTDNRLWQLDMIHFRKGSFYEGYVEKVTDRIISVLTPQTREAILQLKYDIPDTEKVMGIEIYRAVLEGGIANYTDFIEWRKRHSFDGVLEWMP